MRPWLIGTLVLALVAAGMPDPADAKRLGGSRSSGMQRSMPERTAPQTPTTPAAPAQQAVPGAAAAAPAAAGTAAAAAGKRSWMGPIAGLAAGLGLAALMSHLGLGEAFANFLMMALLGVAVVALVFFLMRRFGNGAARGGLATAAAGAGNAGQPKANPWAAQPMARTPLPQAAPVSMPTAQPQPAMPAAPAAAAASTLAPAFVPASFDSEGFARIARAIFIRLQAANDAGDLDDLRRFTTPEMFAELKLDLHDRQGAAQHTDVVAVDAEVLDVASEAERQVVSVRYRGRIVESAGAAPEDFDEIWHLVKPHGDAGSWVIAGIEQSR